VDVLTRLAGEIGLEEQEFREALASRKYREAHQQALRHAYKEAGIQAVPTFIIGDKVVRGLVREEDLRRLIKLELEV
jgi:predicted DsbA family dithiol-disulfide isomerase